MLLSKRRLCRFGRVCVYIPGAFFSAIYFRNHLVENSPGDSMIVALCFKFVFCSLSETTQILLSIWEFKWNLVCRSLTSSGLLRLYIGPWVFSKSNVDELSENSFFS